MNSPINVAKPPITSISMALRQTLPVKNLALKKPNANKPIKAKTIDIIEKYWNGTNNTGIIGIKPPIM